MDTKSERGELPGLEHLVPKQGRRPGDRYVRIVSPRRDFRRAEGNYVATDAAIVPPGQTGRIFAGIRHVLFGKPLATEAEGSERLSVATGYAILASDNISSSAYATEEAMRVLALAGVAALSLTMPIALAIVAVLAVVVLSQLQVIKAYPNGGGSYIVTSDNLGRLPGLVAASSLLIDYVLTVAVSTAAGVAAITSFAPGLHDMRVPLGLAFIAVLAIGNLRGIREAGMIFAIPTYIYVLSLAGLIAYGLFRVVSGDIPAPAIPPDPAPTTGIAVLSVLLILRSFASGSVALTANTGFTGFPRLAAVLANDRFMPRHFADRGERLAFSFGILVLAALASIVLVAFSGSVTALIPLYTIGVFLAFTLSQTGLVRRWLRLRPRGSKVTIVINGVGAVVTGVVLAITTITKFEHGAWMVLIVMPLLVLLLHGISTHYTAAQDSLVVEDLRQDLPKLPQPMVIVPVARLDRTAVHALTFASSISDHVRAVHIATSHETAAAFQVRWDAWAANVPLEVIVSPYRSLVPPLLTYIERVGRNCDRPLTIVVSQFVPRHWWEFFLHSQTAFRLKLALLFRPDTIVIDVPYHPRET